MWPFNSDRRRIAEQVKAALAPGALPSARRRALVALKALPQTERSLACYGQLARDPKQTWEVRYAALGGFALSTNRAGARALLGCTDTDLRGAALAALRGEFIPVLRELGAETDRAIAGVLQAITSEARASARAGERLLGELDAVRKVIVAVDSAGLQELAPVAMGLVLELRSRLIPAFLERARTSRHHREVKEAVAALEGLNSPAAKAALADFRAEPSRLVSKTVPGGIGATEESYTFEVYTSEFGQRPCAAEAAQRAASAAPAPALTPPAAAPAPPEPDLAQDYVAASSCGIQEELLALVNDQISLLTGLHRRGSLAPLAASLDAKGEIHGLALTSEDPAADGPSVEATLEWFRTKFRADAPSGRIVATAIFYHGCHGPGRGAPDVAPAQTGDDADCLVARLDHDSGQAVTCVIQYAPAGEGRWRYAPAYYALRRPDIFLDREYFPLLPDRVGSPRLPRRPARASDHGTHPESMMLLEVQLPSLQKLLQSNSLEPVGCTLAPRGEIQTVLLVQPAVWKENRANLDPGGPVAIHPVAEVGQPPVKSVAALIRLFREGAGRGEVVATALFFHSIYTTPAAAAEGLQPAGIGEEPDCLVAVLDHRLGQTMSVILRYARDARGEWQLGPPEYHVAFPSIFNEDDSSYLMPPAGGT